MTTHQFDLENYVKNRGVSKEIGWQGPGIPNFRTYTSELHRIGQYIWQREFRTAWHRGRSLAANAWNFQVRANQKNVECPCCGWQGPGFLSLSNWRAVQHNSRCPNCDARSRHRGLTILLPELFREKPDGLVLYFAPERSLADLVNRLAGGRVVTTDYLRTDVDFPGEDIQQLGFDDNAFTFLMCNHVLEHIPDDQQAMLECARVLEPGGVAVFTMPGDYSKQDTWYFDRPDSNGHFRHYGLDVVAKLQRGFSRVEVVEMGQGKDPRWHIHPGDFAFVCRK